ncbi:MAG TPA: methyl-accepting chemotaxis protein [Candidatus Elarobacter sp.]
MLETRAQLDDEAALIAIAGHFAALADPHGVADLTRPLAIPSGCSDAAAGAADALNAFVARMRSTLLDVCKVSNDVSSGAAENTFLLARIAGSTESQSAETTQVAAAVHETAQAAEIVTQSTEATRDLTAELRRASRTSFETMEASLAQLDDVRAVAERAVSDVDIVVEFSNQIEMVTEVIEDISTRSQMLGINAAIEAAHAGEGGRGFGIVAQEIKRLAESTKNSTREIAQLVENVRAAVESARAATARSSDGAAQLAVSSGRVRDELTAMTKTIDGTTEQIAAIAAAVDEQSTTLHVVSENVERLSTHAREVASYSSQATDLELAHVSTDIFAITGRYALGTFFEQVLQWGDAFATDVERSIERAVDTGRVRFDALFDTNYVELVGTDARTLSRLFNVARLGANGFDPPKYRTSYDQLVDEPLMEICDRHAAHDPKLIFASLTDVNGFFVMGPKGLRRDITGNREADLAGNRIKRLFADKTALRASRVGLPKPGELPRIVTRDLLAQRGVSLRRPDGDRTFLRQTYARDTGKIYTDVAFPVYVKGERWGSVRIAYDPSAV